MFPLKIFPNNSSVFLNVDNIFLVYLFQNSSMSLCPSIDFRKE